MPSKTSTNPHRVKVTPLLVFLAILGPLLLTIVIIMLALYGCWVWFDSMVYKFNEYRKKRGDE